MASNTKSRPEVEQIDLTKLSLPQLQQLKTEFESVCVMNFFINFVSSTHPTCVKNEPKSLLCDEYFGGGTEFPYERYEIRREKCALKEFGQF